VFFFVFSHAGTEKLRQQYPRLDKDLVADVIVVGGGIAGEG
jgi:ribulose 1,5-bisphosphate synthetase/thiazole synthase